MTDVRIIDALLYFVSNVQGNSLSPSGTSDFCGTVAAHVARVWQELDYRIEICRVTKGIHIEHL